MSVIKKLTVCIVSFTFFFFCCIYADSNGQSISVSAPVKTEYTVVIDAGHGGYDGGAVAEDGTCEQEINLKIASRLAQMLKLHGYNVVMTRSTSEGIEEDPSESIANRKKSDMYERLRIMKENPDGIFISIHLNKFTTTSAEGTQVFYSPNVEGSEQLGLSVQKTVASLLQPQNKRTIKKGSKSTFLLHKATIPAVIVECGFLSNKRELELLKSEEYQAKMAFAVLCGILNYGR